MAGVRSETVAGRFVKMNNVDIDFRINYSWEDPGGVTASELAATWARIGMTCGNKVITSVHCSRVQAFRGDIYVPLYAIAEWFVRNWWFIMNECTSADKMVSADFRLRHTLAASNEGICLPEVSFVRIGDEIMIRWQAVEYPSAGINFQTSGSCLIDKDVFISRIAQLIDDVIDRLHKKGVSATFLEEEWQAILAIEESGDEEKSFCEVSARLGLDPFCIDGKLSDRIITCYNDLEPDIRDEFFFSSSSQSFEPNVRWLDHAREKIETQTCIIFDIDDERLQTRHYRLDKQPWLTGYGWARTFRKALGISGEPIDFNDFVTFSNDALPGLPLSEASLEALVCHRNKGNFSMILNRNSFDLENENTRFLFARILSETLSLKNRKSGILSKVDSIHQKISRAFAAELLAPSDVIAKMIPDNRVNDETIEKIKEHFNVSDYVIRHQIINHNLATIIAPEPDNLWY